MTDQTDESDEELPDETPGWLRLEQTVGEDTAKLLTDLHNQQGGTS